MGDAALARVTQWEVESAVDSFVEWADSSTQGYTAIAPGPVSCMFTCAGKFENTANSVRLFAPGDFVSATLKATSILFWSFPRALCLSYRLSVNVDTGEVDEWRAMFRADGFFQRPLNLNGANFNVI